MPESDARSVRVVLWAERLSAANVFVFGTVREWSGRIQAAESVKKGDYSKRTAIRIYCTAESFHHTQNDHSHA